MTDHSLTNSSSYIAAGRVKNPGPKGPGFLNLNKSQKGNAGMKEVNMGGFKSDVLESAVPVERGGLIGNEHL